LGVIETDLDQSTSDALDTIAYDHAMDLTLLKLAESDLKDVEYVKRLDRILGQIQKFAAEASCLVRSPRAKTQPIATRPQWIAMEANRLTAIHYKCS
jgi:hypothetical protein